MSLGPRLDILQTQALVLTPQLQQAIRLLQLSNLELEAVIAEEIAKNPLLETASGGEDDSTPATLPDASSNVAAKLFTWVMYCAQSLVPRCSPRSFTETWYVCPGA